MLETIEYKGDDGISQFCIDAIVKLINTGYTINNVMLLSNRNRHSFLFNINCYDKYIVIKSGFASGYVGEGPNALAYILDLLQKHCDDMDEYIVSDKLMSRINKEELKEKDLENILTIKPVRPKSLFNYLQKQ